MRSSGAKRADRSCARHSVDTAKTVGVGLCRNSERQVGHTGASTVQGIETEAVLGYHFWTKGYCVDTVGLDMEKIQAYVQYQDQKDQKIEQRQLGL